MCSKHIVADFPALLMFLEHHFIYNPPSGPDLQYETAVSEAAVVSLVESVQSPSKRQDKDALRCQPTIERRLCQDVFF